jgi:plastocyanin
LIGDGRKMRSYKLSLIAGTLIIATCLSGLALGAGLGEVYPPLPQYVDIKNNTTNPSSITVPLNTTVVWSNHNNVAETVTAVDGSFDSENISAGGYEYRYIFLMPGRYEYYSRIHPSIKGSVIVENASGEMQMAKAEPGKNASINAAKAAIPGKSMSANLSAINSSINVTNAPI